MFNSGTFTMYRLVILIIVNFTIADNNRSACRKIVGGQAAHISDYPYQLSFRFDEKHVCGASLIAKKWALTAAHCTNQKSPEKFNVVAGITTLNETGQRAKVINFFQHPEFTREFMDYDVSLLELETDLTLSSKVQIIEMAPEGSDIAPGTNVLVSGWGYTSIARVSNTLQKVEMPVIDRTECDNLLGEDDVTDNMICAGLTERGVDACNGDSGGPLVAHGRLVGIVSWGHGCAKPNCPGVYARVATARSFIKKHSGV